MAAQHYLDQARQMQALSLTVHLVLVCFGIAFPSMVIFAEWRYLRTGDTSYRMIARRWSKVMVTLFAVGVVTGTIVSFEFGIVWPNFIGTFGGVFGLGFALEGFSFFLEAIFSGIYVYGWDRLTPRAHLLSGLPIVLAGVSGSTFVITVNAWMNHPSGFQMRNGKPVDVHPWTALFGNSFLWAELVHMYLAAYIVTGFLVAGWYGWCFLRRRFGRSAGFRQRACIWTSARQRRADRLPDDGRYRNAARAPGRDLPRGKGAPAAPPPLSLVLPGARRCGPALLSGRRRGLDHDRGWSSTLDRLWGDENVKRRHGRKGHPGGVRDARRGVRGSGRRGRLDPAAHESSAPDPAKPCSMKRR